ncbi:MAG TPA: ABC transporter permease [Verrucomicrobiae bacterium]|nr:ABC transporter permease [Verrucomicrobiae bacterium]
MQPYLTLVRRELGALFLSLAGYVVIAVVMLMLGLSFVEIVSALNGSATEQPMTEMFYSTVFFWMIILLATPVITMRTFAQEKYSGTFETLMTTPVSDLQVVLAKFSGALLFYLITWLPLVACLLIVRHYANDDSVLDWRAIATTYLGITLLGCLYLSLGVFASAMTRSQIVAAMISYALGIGLFVLSFFAYATQVKTGWQARLFSQVSMFEHMQDFVRGVVDTRHIVFYTSLTVFFLFLTFKAVESRRWK